MWRKREIMVLQSKTVLDTIIEDVPTDVSGKWVNKDELREFGKNVAGYILMSLEHEAENTNTPELYGICTVIKNDFDMEKK